MMMNRTLLIAALVLGSVVAPVATSQAQRFYVSIEDRPHYRHGREYWRDDVRYVWVSGYRAPSGRWIRGHYVARDRRSPIDRAHRRHRIMRNRIFGR